MTKECFLRSKLYIHNISDLQPDYESGTLVLADSQAVIDECEKRSIPVVGIEYEGQDHLRCQQIIINEDDVDDEDYERIYRRCAGIPWDIAYTNRCFIREYGPSDLDDLFELYNQDHMTEYMEPLFEYEEERQYEENYIEYIYKLYGFGIWLIFDKFTGKLIGRAGIEVRETCDRENQAELGFAISPARWRQGLAYEVCSKIIDLARDDYGITSLIARCDPANEASSGLLKKLGFECEGFEPDGDYRFFREI
ncbi:MAG: GNAT family N-acetyltransferase [Pseudobutyrivibrio sp.]|nr:GNAT family N-acetyltransferase [Pseudobutyrivibrio sp.]